MDEYIKNTFDMLVDRINNLEDKAERNENALRLAECLKYGRLNNHYLGHKFPITREPPFRNSDGHGHDVIERMSMVLVTTEFFGTCSCGSGAISIPYRAIGRDDLADKEVRLFDNENWIYGDQLNSRDVGWTESSYFKALSEAYDRYLKQKFQDSGFIPTYISDHTVALSIPLDTSEYETVAHHPFLYEFIDCIPMIATCLGHTVRCIREVCISSVSPYTLRDLQVIHYAVSMEDGLEKTRYKTKADSLSINFIMAIIDSQIPYTDEFLSYIESRGLSLRSLVDI